MVNNKSRINKFVYWTPRIIAILFIAFLVLLSLDVFSEDSNPGQIALGLLVHNIPALILLALLIIAWKYEIVGVIVFTVAGLSYIILVALDAPAWHLAVS